MLRHSLTGLDETALLRRFPGPLVSNYLDHLNLPVRTLVVFGKREPQKGILKEAKHEIQGPTGSASVETPKAMVLPFLKEERGVVRTLL